MHNSFLFFTFVSLSVRFGSVNDDLCMFFFPCSQRRCMFSSDIRNAKSISYFRSNCIRVCRLESIIALCNCIPFFYRDLMYAFINSTKICTLDKVPCLSHYNGIHLLHESINKLTPSKCNCLSFISFLSFRFMHVILMGPRVSGVRVRFLQSSG